MKKLLYVLVAVIIAVSCFTVAVSADDGRTLTVVSVTEKSITFKYTGAKAGDNNWVGVYTKDASVCLLFLGELSGICNSRCPERDLQLLRLSCGRRRRVYNRI